MSTPSSDVAFSPAVKAIQEARGSRATLARMEERGGWRTAISADLAAFLVAHTSFYLATASAEGQPYIQHRGGPPGFLRVIDERTLAFADFRGNRQYITTGNLSENPRVMLFLMDYESRRRIKIWGAARIVTDDADLLARLMPDGYDARPEQAVVVRVEAWDTNCPQHIPQLFKAEDVAHTLSQLQARLREMDAENTRLKARIAELERHPGAPCTVSPVHPRYYGASMLHPSRGPHVALRPHRYPHWRRTVGGIRHCHVP